MRVFRHSSHQYTNLPDQESLSTLPSVLFGHIEKRSLTILGWRWRKRCVFLNTSGHLIIYKYFLEGIGAGEPFVGKIIHLDAAQNIQARMTSDVCCIKIRDQCGKRTELRVKGSISRLWAAKVFIRSTSEEIDWPVEKRSLNVLSSEIIAPSILDISKTDQVKSSAEISKPSSASVSSESLPDYTASDASNKNSHSPVQILGDQKLRIRDMVTTRGSESKSSTSENISMQKATLIHRGFTAKEHIEKDGRLKRSQSASEFSTTVEFSTTQGATKSLSLSHLDSVLASRRDRFRKHLQSMIESRLYESITDCSLNRSVTSLQQLRTQAGNLRMSQIYIPHDNALYLKAEVLKKVQLTQRSGPSAPLSTDIYYKSSKTPEETDSSQTDVVYRF